MIQRAIKAGHRKLYDVGCVRVVGPATPGIYTQMFQDEPSSLKTLTMTRPFFAYDMDIDEDGNFSILQEHVASFLIDNEVPILTGEDICSEIKEYFGPEMHLSQVLVEGEYGNHGTGKRIGSDVDPVTLKKGEVSISLKFELDFDEHVLKPGLESYIDSLKASLCEAFKLPPGAARFIEVSSVKKGSIEVVIILAACFVLAATFVAALYSGRKFHATAPGGAGVGMGEAPRTRTRQVYDVTYVQKPDGEYHIRGKLMKEKEEP
jgi:hypothetical protein